MGAKTRLSPQLFAGRVTEWKGTYGWIESLEPIEHPEAQRHNGKIFVHKDDIEGKQLREGVICEFFLYVDAQGLGADKCYSRQVLRLMIPVDEGKRLWGPNGEKICAVEDSYEVSLRIYEWYHNNQTKGSLPFLVECWGRPDALVNFVTGELHAEFPALEFLIPQSRLMQLQVPEMQGPGVEVQLSNLTAIDDPMPCYPLNIRGSKAEVGQAVRVLIDQICDK